VATTIAVPAATERFGRGLSIAVHVVLAFVTLCLLSLIVLWATGFRALIVHSGSMAPTIEMGDVAVTRLTRPGSVAAGEVITFRDPSRSQVLVTHRVVSKQRSGDRYSFTTRGDTNNAIERWSIEADGTLGRLVFRVPNIGYGLWWVTAPPVRIALVAGAILILGGVAVRRIWFR
jgi:signal peptidase